MTKQSTNPPKLALRDLVANNSFAAAFQTMGQYRAALLKHDATERAQHTESFAWAVFAENGNVIIWSKNREQVEIASAKYGQPVVPVIALSAAQQAAPPGALAARPHKIAELLCIYDEQGGDWCKIARTVESRYIDPTSAPGTPEAPDPVVEANRQLLLDRSRVGLVKYGKPLEATSLSHAELTQHALEEALDLANYLQAILRKERAAQLDGGKGEAR